MNDGWLLAGLAFAALAFAAAAVAGRMQRFEPDSGHFDRARTLLAAATAATVLAWLALVLLHALGVRPISTFDAAVGPAVLVGSVALAWHARRLAPGATASAVLQAGAAALFVVSAAWALHTFKPGEPWTRSGAHAAGVFLWAAASGLLLVPYARVVAHVQGLDPLWADASLGPTRVAFALGFLGLVLESQVWVSHALWQWSVRETSLAVWVGLVTVLVHGLLYGRKGRFLLLSGPMAAVAVPAAFLAGAVALLVGPETLNLARVAQSASAFAPATRALVLALGLVLTVPALLHAVAVRLRHPSRATLMFAIVLACLAAGSLFAFHPPHFERALSYAALIDSAQPLLVLLVPFGLLMGSFLVASTFGRRASPPEPVRGLERWLVMGRLVALGMGLLYVGILAVLAAAALELGETQRRGAETAATIAGVPFLVVLGIALGNQGWGRRNLLLALDGLVVGAVGLIAWTDLPIPFVLVASAAVFAAAGAFTKIYQSCAAADAPVLLRAAGALLLLTGLAGFVQWAADPSGWWFVRWWHPPREWSLLGMAASVLVVSAGIHALRRRNLRWCVAGAVAAAVFTLHVVGLVALVLLWRTKRDFVSVIGRPAMAALRREHRKTAVYAAHWALCLALLAHSAAQWAPLPMPWDALETYTSRVAWGSALLLFACLGVIPFLQDPRPPVPSSVK